MSITVILTMTVMTILPFHPANAQSQTQLSADGAPSAVNPTSASGEHSEGPDDSGSDEVEVEGWLRSAPADKIGEWQIEKSENNIVRVISDGNTLFDTGLPPVGSWVKAKGTLNLDNSILALRFRIDDYEADEVVVRLKDNGVAASTVAARYGLLVGETLLQSGRIYLFRLSSSDADIDPVLDQIKNDSDIVWAEYNYVGSAPGGNPFRIWGWGGTSPDGYENQFAFQQVNVDPAHQQYQGDNIKIAVLDTGVAMAHPSLSSHLTPGWDVVADDATPQDEGTSGYGWGHGTHVSGIVAKIAPKALIMPLRVLDENGRGNTFTLAYAIDWAVQHDADVINMSLGTPYISNVLRDAVNNAIANGVVVVAAAGNDNKSAPQYPAAFDGVISVSAVDSSNHKAIFSNYGDWVDIAAPGLGITSTIIGAKGLGYASWSGTSMATGFVSGAAALIKQKQPNASNASVLQMLTANGVNIDSSNPVAVGRLLNVSAALGVTGGQATTTPTATSPTATAVSSTHTPTPEPTDNPSTPTPQRTPTPTSTTIAGANKIFLPVVNR